MKTKLKEDLVAYSIEITNQFTDFKRQEFLSKEKAFEKFMEKRDLYLRLYEGIDRFIYNERERLGLKYKTFTTNKISSWQEDVTKNTIMIFFRFFSF